MLDTRLDLLQDYLEEFFGDADFVLSKASDDASFRRYFRIERVNTTFIAMDAPPDKENTKAFIRIDELLRSGDIHAPKIIDSNLKNGFLLIEDLGNQTFLQAQKDSFDINLYKKAIDVVIQMQEIETNSNEYGHYDASLLNAEMQLLVDWYLPKDLDIDLKNALNTIFDLLTQNALNQKQVFVHRDYHSRNLMITDDDLGVIDFQDGVIGAISYDLVSLLKDAYFELSSDNLNTLLHYYYDKKQLDIGFDVFEKQFDLMGLQRHLKVLGIFKRLSIRDGKHQYLGDIPLVKKYALNIADKYPELSCIKNILQATDNQTHAMILAAGRGERMMPLTKNTPKSLIKLNDKPLIDYVVLALKKANINNIVINTAYLGEKIHSYLGHGESLDMHIQYSDESAGALETAGGIIKALPLLGDKPFIVVNSDVVCDYDLKNLKLPMGSLAHLVLIDNPEHNKHGDFSIINEHQVTTAGHQSYTYAGIGIYHPNFFKAHKSNQGIKLPLYPLLKEAMVNNQLTGEYYDGYWQDVGTPQRLQQAEEQLGADD